jgi:glycosyltransferase involved in cell wall biosynthesis
MKILMIAPEPFFTPRGTPISVHQRLLALSKLGHQVDLLTLHLGQDPTIPGVTIHRVPKVPFIKHVRIGPSWAKAVLDILLFCQAILLLIKNQYDVIHSHEEAAFFSVLLSKVFRTRHLYDMHSSLPRQLENFNFWNHWPIVKLAETLERWTINTCDAVITVGSDLEERLIAINPKMPSVKIENLALHTYNGTASHSAARELKEKIKLGNKLPIVYTGSFERYQGLDILLKSAKIVKDHHPEVSLIMVGGSPQQVEHWKNEARQLGLEGCTRFTGIVPPEEAVVYLEIAQILVSPRINGTSVPLKIYSYLYSGKAIVATDLPAHTQVLNEKIAVLVAPTQEALANGILKLVQSPDLRRRMGRRAQQFAKERFNAADYLAKVDQIYQELIPSTRPPEQAAPPPQPDQARSQKQAAVPPPLNPES